MSRWGCPHCGAPHRSNLPYRRVAGSVDYDIECQCTCGQWVQQYVWIDDRKPAADPRFPHRCPTCRGPVYIGFTAVEHPPGVECRRR